MLQETRKVEPPSRLATNLVGWLLYPSGDLLAQFIMGGEINFRRALVIMLVGGLLYRLEIPAWFRRIDAFKLEAGTLARKPWLLWFTKSVEGTTDGSQKLNWLGRTIAAMVYFNPVWIARHVFFISLATTGVPNGLLALVTGSLVTGCISFVTNLPISLTLNYLIQSHVPLRVRFLASASATTLLTVKYAIELRFFT